jgi:hypothetical protein
MIPEWQVKVYGADGKRRQGQLYLRFVVVGEAQTLTAESSASPTDIKPRSLPTTGLSALY